MMVLTPLTQRALLSSWRALELGSLLKLGRRGMLKYQFGRTKN
jgi:hypothetical protein